MVIQTDSDVIYVNMIGQSIAVLHSAEAALDLIDKRGNVYNERPNFNFFEECCFRSLFLLLGADSCQSGMEGFFSFLSPSKGRNNSASTVKCFKMPSQSLIAFNIDRDRKNLRVRL
jgi:hypothetical protein